MTDHLERVISNETVRLRNNEPSFNKVKKKARRALTISLMG
jgi:hypothetical protein